MSELAEGLLSIYYLIGATAGIVSVFLAYWNWRKDRPIIKPIILGCHHEGARPTTVTAELEIRNVGRRPTSLSDLQLNVRDDSTELHAISKTLLDARQIAKIERPYPPEERPDLHVDLPMLIGAGLTERLIASFHLDGTVTHREAKCILTVRCTHGKKTAEFNSRSTPLHAASLPRQTS